jgi:hypothetical protein
MYKVIFTLVAVASLMGLHAQEFQEWRCTSQNQYGGF